MHSRSFLKAAGLVAAGATAAPRPAFGHVPAHNWDRYDFGVAPPITHRLYQGPFPDELLPSWDVVMAPTPSSDVVPNFGMGLITYLWDEVGQKPTSKTLRRSLEDLVKLPLGAKLYLRVNWFDVHKALGKLELPELWKISFDLAKTYGKRVGFRVQLGNPDILRLAMPEWVSEKVPLVKMGEWAGKTQHEPRYDHPFYQEAFEDLVTLLADAFDGHSQVEFVDTFMYGFWGEGHTWPFESPRHPFPDGQMAEDTFVRMFELQRSLFRKTPLVTNAQPDFSQVGNSELVDRTVRSFNWLRTDTIYIENMQIETLSNRPPWMAAVIEVGMSDGSPESLRSDEGVTHTDNEIAHVRDVGANYWSLWNWHQISAEGIESYYRQYPGAIDRLARSIGYRVRPSWVWHYEKEGRPGLVIGFANDGIAGVPGVLVVSLASDDGKVKLSGSLDPGHPLPGKVRQAQFALPQETDWRGLKLRAELEVKGVRYPVRWACHQKLNADGLLTLRPTRGVSG